MLFFLTPHLAWYCLLLVHCRPHTEDAELADVHQQHAEKRAVIAGLATAGLILNGLSGIFGSLFGGSKDTVDVSSVSLGFI